MPEPKTILCLASYFKGSDFIEACKREGGHVILLTRQKLAEEAWPWQSIGEVFYMPDLSAQPDVTHAVSYLARSRVIDQVIPLDDYDVLTAAALRDHLRLPGMGLSQARYVRDKLAMRQGAVAAGLPVPAFAHVLNYDHLRTFMARVPPPWLLKPRAEAGAMGIKKLRQADELWPWLERLGDEQSSFLLEQFIPGDVFHVDAISWQGKVLFAAAHQYGQPPIDVAHEGGVFMSRTLPATTPEAATLLALNEKLLAALGVKQGATHTEFIRAHADGRFYFLETAARVGGANIADLVAAASGLNLWAEWCRVELAALRQEAYELPPLRQEYAGILICLARQEHPDTSAYTEPEIVWRMQKKHHAGLIVASPDAGRVAALLADYGRRFAQDFLAVAPPLDKPPV